MYCFALYCILSYRIILYRIISCHIVSYRIVSYLVLPYCYQIVPPLSCWLTCSFNTRRQFCGVTYQAIGSLAEQQWSPIPFMSPWYRMARRITLLGKGGKDLKLPLPTAGRTRIHLNFLINRQSNKHDNLIVELCKVEKAGVIFRTAKIAPFSPFVWFTESCPSQRRPLGPLQNTRQNDPQHEMLVCNARDI